MDQKQHPYVTLLNLKRTGWTAVWTEPTTGQKKQQSMSRLGLTTKADRIRFCSELSKRLVFERRQMLLGMPVVHQIALADAVRLRLESLSRNSASSIRSHREVLRHVSAFMGTKRLAAMTDADLARLRDYLARPSISDSTVQLHRVIAGSFFDWCRERDYCGVHLTDRGVKLLKKTQARPLRVRTKQVLSPEEVRSVREQLEGIDLDMFDVFMLTGCRLNEVIQLDLDRDLLEDCLRLRPETTKTKQARDIHFDIAPRLQSILRRYSGTPFIKRRATFIRRLRAAGVSGAHTLRRTVATTLLGANLLPPYVAAQRMGHSLTIMLRDYAGLVRPSQFGEGSTIDEALGL